MPALDSAFATAFGIKRGKVDDLRARGRSATCKLELKRKVEATLKDQAMKALRETTQFALPQVAGRDGSAAARCGAWRANCSSRA